MKYNWILIYIYIYIILKICNRSICNQSKTSQEGCSSKYIEHKAESSHY